MKNIKTVFYGGKQAGMIALLTLKSIGYDVVCVVPCDDIVKDVAKKLGIDVQTPTNMNDGKFIQYLKNTGASLFVCCHGKQILRKELLNSFICVNMHPCLSKYKGKDPIGRAIQNKDSEASVGLHYMIEKVDEGEVIEEIYTKISGKTVSEVYNELYPLYSMVLIIAKTKIDSAVFGH